MNVKNDFKILVIILLFIFELTSSIKAQSTSYSQFWNEIQFARPINNKWSAEINIGSTFSSTDSSSRVFQNLIQRMGRIGIHHYYSPRWKFSTYLAYYIDKDVPEIGQYETPEYRLSLQSVYYIHKINYTLTTQMRVELRLLKNPEGDFEDIYRYRQNIKFLKPVNSKILRQGVFYVLAMDEIYLKSEAKSTGVNFFDRNQLSLGGGYMLTDDIQLELLLVNEFMPRDDADKFVNALSFTLTFNNLISNVKESLLPVFESDDKAN
jgi:hypothetical protein